MFLLKTFIHWFLKKQTKKTCRTWQKIKFELIDETGKNAQPYFEEMYDVNQGHKRFYINGRFVFKYW